MPDKAVKSTQTNQTTNPRLDPIDKSETAGWWKEKLSSAEVFEANQSKNPAFRMRRITFSMLLRNYKEEIKNTPFVVLVENKPVFKVVSLNATFIDLDRPSNKIDWTLTPEEEAQQAKDQAEYEAAKKAKLEAQTSTPPSVTTPVPPPVDPVQIAKELTPEEKVKTESFIEAKLKQIGNFFQPEQEKAAEETPVQKVEAPPAPFIKEAWVVPAPQMSPLEAETKAQIDPMYKTPPADAPSADPQPVAPSVSQAVPATTLCDINMCDQAALGSWWIASVGANGTTNTLMKLCTKHAQSYGKIARDDRELSSFL